MTMTLLPNIFHRIGDELLGTHLYRFEPVPVTGREVLIQKCAYCGKIKPYSNIAMPDPLHPDGRIVVDTRSFREDAEGDTDR